jgi:predicted metal-binding membrane protein
MVCRFGQEVEGRRHRLAATALMATTYLAVWLAFGVLVYIAYTALRMPWPSQRIAGAVAIGLAALYGLTPLKRAAQARCRELCALHEPLPFDVLRAGGVAGFRYGVSCLGCNAFLMVAMPAVGMTNLAWAAVVAGLAVLYRVIPRPGRRYEFLVSAALAAGAVAYLFSA